MAHATAACNATARAEHHDTTTNSTLRARTARFMVLASTAATARKPSRAQEELRNCANERN
eukprot:2025727-Lingulodinium_polyedra.AAC.1